MPLPVLDMPRLKTQVERKSLRDDGRCRICVNERRKEIEKIMLQPGKSAMAKWKIAKDQNIIPDLPYRSFLNHFQKHPITNTGLAISEETSIFSPQKVDDFLERTISAGYEKVTENPKVVSVKDAIDASKIKTQRDQFQQKSDMLKQLLQMYMSGERGIKEIAAVEGEVIDAGTDFLVEGHSQG